MMNDEVIAAISTPLGEGGIAIIRISGENCFTEVERIFHAKTKLTAAKTHTIHYGHIIDPIKHEQIEEVLISIMRKPRSFTMENIVEIHTHGGMIAARKVMDILLQQGIRLAEPGEFTKRAFLNGRIDLLQAEAVIDLIRSKSDRAFHMAMKQAQGQLSRRIKLLRQRIIEILAHIEVNIDYPEHDIEQVTSSFIQERCQQVIEEINELLKTATEGKILREGIMTAIIGRPNVGKSSLLNMLAQDNKAIVTDIPGTTRDVIEQFVTINGIPLRLLDTAGIRETTDVIEQLGVERSRHALQEADLILFVVNNDHTLQSDEREWLKQISEKQVVVVINKIDLPTVLDERELKEMFGENRIVRMSAKEQVGLMDLDKIISTLFFHEGIEQSDMTYVSNVRHIALLKQTLHALQDAVEATKLGVAIDIIQIDIHTAWERLGEVIGDAVGESLLDQIFAQFCLGK